MSKRISQMMSLGLGGWVCWLTGAGFPTLGICRCLNLGRETSPIFVILYKAESRSSLGSAYIFGLHQGFSF